MSSVWEIWRFGKYSRTCLCCYFCFRTLTTHFHWVENCTSTVLIKVCPVITVEVVCFMTLQIRSTYFDFFECKYGHINTEWYPCPSILLSDLHLFLSTDQEPWPSCAEFDEQGIAYVCLIFYNTTFSATQVSGCVKLNVLVETEIIIPLKCFTLPRPKAIAIDNKSQAVMARKWHSKNISLHFQ